MVDHATAQSGAPAGWRPAGAGRVWEAALTSAGGCATSLRQSGPLDRRGTSLTDLILVVTVSSLALLVATPPLAKLYQGSSTRLAARQFVTTHRMARSVAVGSGRMSELHIDAVTGRVWVEVDTASAGEARDTVGQVKYLGEYGVVLTADRTVLCFDSRGLPLIGGACDAPDATLVFSSEDRRDTVRISALGKVLR